MSNGRQMNKKDVVHIHNGILLSYNKKESVLMSLLYRVKEIRKKNTNAVY